MLLQDLLRKALQDLYRTESEQIRRLNELAGTATFPELKVAFEEHAVETRQHVTRLSQVLGLLGETPGGEGQVPDGIRGLIREAEDGIDDVDDDGLRDVVLIQAAQKMEHYEIACYGTLRAIAHTLGMDQEARLLQTTLEEEERADARLTTIALVLYKQVGQEAVL
jgi:ferritin-like metal-binding protein YciE